MRSFRILIFLLAAIFNSALLSAEVKASDIQEITHVCMNAESAFQDYILIGIGITNNDPEKDIAEKVASIDTFLKNVSSHDLGSKNNAELKELQVLWSQIRPKITSKPKKEDVVLIKKQIDEFIIKCEKLDEHLATDVHSKVAEDLVLISELGIDVQRLTSMYLIKAWGVDLKGYDKEAKEIIARFDDEYKRLMAESDKNVPKKIKSILRSVNKDFLLFKIMAVTDSKRYVPSLAQKKSAKIQKSVMLALQLEEDLMQ